MTIKFTGNAEAGKQLMGAVLREQFNINNHAKAFGYGVLRRNLTFENGAKVDTLYLKSGVQTTVFYPTEVTKKEEPIKLVRSITLVAYTVDLVSMSGGYSGAYAITDTIEQIVPLTLMTGAELESKYKLITGYTDDPWREDCCYIDKDPNGITDFAYVSEAGKEDWHKYAFILGSKELIPIDHGYTRSITMPDMFSGFAWFSHSPHTYQSHNKVHTIRSINQDKRLYAPNFVKSLGSAYAVGTRVRGKKVEFGYLKTYSSSSITTDDPEGYLLFWPFIPYMWEITAYPVYFFNVPTPPSLYYNGIFDIWGSLAKWRLVNAAGSEIDLYEDVFGFISILTPTLTGWELEFTVNSVKYLPIAPVGNGITLYTSTRVIGTGKITYDKMEGSDMSGNQSLHAGDVEFRMGWLPTGSYSGFRTATNITTFRSNSQFTVTSKLQLGETVVCSGEGTLGHTSSLTLSTESTDSTTASITQTGPGLPWVPNTVSWPVWIRIAKGERSGSCGATRDLRLVEVLDYDSTVDANGESPVHKVAVVYKKIQIGHGSIRTATFKDNHVTMAAGSQEEVEHMDTDEYVSDSGRTVTYCLYVSIGEKVFEAVLGEYPSFSSTAKVVAGAGIAHAGNGIRLYGITCKIVDNNVLVTYDKEEFIDDYYVALGYDSAYNYEDWNYPLSGDTSKPLWRTLKRVVGIFNFDDPENFGVSILDEHDPIKDDVYGINLNKTETIITTEGG
jgi:hypothetical protein